MTASDVTQETLSDYSWWFGESLDRLVSVEMRPHAVAHGKIRPLYDAVVAKTGRKSLSLAAAQALTNAVSAGDNVLIVTGAGVPPYLPYGENDGPVGAAVIARALSLGIGAFPVYIAEPHHAGPIVASSEAAGLPVRPTGTPKVGYSAFIDEIDVTGGDQWAATAIAKWNPKAVIFIEKIGSNEKGVAHNSTGLSDYTPPIGDTSALARAASDNGILTVGIGDAGNEIGCGLIFDDVRRIQDFGAVCRCPCGGGMAASAATDHLIFAAVSNWGAYALEAALAHILRRVDLPHGPAIARRILDACLNARGYEALHCSARDLVDCVDGATSVSLAQILAEMVRLSLSDGDAGPVH